MNMIPTLMLLALAFALFGFFNGSEMAYISCNKLKLRHLADDGNPAAKIISRFHQEPQRLLTMILIGSNLMHVTAVGFATYLLETRFGIKEEWMITAILAPPIIIFAETIPKDWFRLRADDFIYRFAPILDLLDQLLGGVSVLLSRFCDGIVQLLGGKAKGTPVITRDEFRYVIEESARGGVLHDYEKQMIHTILNLSSVPVSEVLVPISKFPRLPLTSRVADVKDIARKTEADAILVYEEIPSIVVGILYVFDILFMEDENVPLARFLKAPIFIRQDTSLEKAIFLLQSKHASYGVALNFQGEVTGVVKLENLISAHIPKRT